MKTILHIGRHKTGTTALQEFFGLNDELLLRRAGILYPTAGRDKIKHYHHAVFHDVLYNNRHINQSLLGTILAEADNKNATSILLSSEVLSRPDLTEDTLTVVRDSFDGHALRLIVYLRSQDDFLQSWYAEMIRRGALMAPRTINDINAGLDYFRFLEKYAKVFGADAITVRIYDEAIRSNLFEDFLSVLGVQDTSGFVMPDARPNRRLPWAYLALLRLANKRRWQRKLVRHRKVEQLARWLYDHLPRFVDAPKPLDTAERLALLAQYESKNAEVAKKYLQREWLFINKSLGQSTSEKRSAS